MACHFAGVEGGQRIATPGRAVVGGAGAAADVIPQCLQVGAFIQGQWQRAAQVAALAVGQRGLPGAEAVTALMGQRQLVALVALVGGVAHARLHHAAGDRAAAVRVGNDRVADAPQAGQAVQRAGLAFAVVVLLPRDVVVQPQLVVIVDAEVQAHAGVPVGVGHRLATATEADAALPQAAVGQGQCVPLRIGGFGVVVAAAYRQAEAILDQWAAEVNVGGACIAELVVLLHGEALGERAVPAVLVAAGDDVDDAAHRIRAVQGGHRAAYHFDALDGIQRRQVGELAAAEVVRVQLADVALAAAIDQYQGVLGGQAAHRDGGAAVLVDWCRDACSVPRG
ncbi:hypothetical protein G6F35_011778 [Rhizopus arrhizus]|nr:hypothetical protein G6F35_011778 [Rhizopus arrhizus]